ncbi:hypothetical protein EUX98_g2676 [Antrodiella citrinella]|uniref:MARVEL domain-containing protein n=1 Tax=Antrodiella citrinella TaxID=2447956 RepID=A0A4S4MYF1_9APHY|nr:hypothetical protein EUX98_g2676 [Antrodiella citrinella]
MFDRHTVPSFILLTCSLVLLVLTTFSVPFVKSFYFFRADINGGVTFGMWGWCFDLSGQCSPKQFGYVWVPQLTQILTKLLILFPAAAGLTLISMAVLTPVMFSRYSRMHPFPLFALLALATWLCSAAAFGISLANWLIARNRFHKSGVATSLGPLIWMDLGALVLLLIVATNASCGSLCRGHMGRRHSGVYFTY